MAYDPPPPRTHIVRLGEQLKSPDVAKRLHAVRELGGAMDGRDIRPAAEALGTVFDDPSPKVRLEALRRLDSVLWRKPVTEKELSAGRADGDSKAEWLLKKVLSAAQDKKDDAQQAAALRALGCFRVPRASAVLQKALSEKKPAIRAAAISGMKRAGSKQFVGSLLKALEDPDHQVQKAAIHALFQVSYMGTHYTKALQPAVKPLMKMLESQEHPLWCEAARALGKLRDEQAVPMLVKALENPKLTQAAASALYPIRTQTALDAVVAGLKSKHDAVRRACTGVLIVTDPKYDRQVIGPLMAALKDKDAEVVCCAAYAMEKRRVTEAVPSLIELLKHRQPQVRRVTARALGRIGDKRASAPLKLLLKDPSESVRDAAGKALWFLGVRNVGWKPKPSRPHSRPSGRG